MSRRAGRPKIPEERLLEELRRVADELGAPPTATQMDRHGEYSVTTYRNRFGRWTLALLHAGLDPDRS